MKLSFFSFVACITLCGFFLAAAPASPAAGVDSGLSSGELPPPVIVNPDEIAELRGVDHVTFRWQAVQGAAAYHLILARDRRFKNVVAENAHVKETLYTVGKLNYGTYFLKMSSVSPSGAEGPFSERLSFIVVPPPPAVAPQ